MEKIEAVKCIQSFYRRIITYPKTEAGGGYLPIDPIYRTPFSKDRLLKIFHIIDGKFHAQYFCVDSLAEWIGSRKEFVNPITNLEFSGFEISQIKSNLRKFKIEIEYPAQNSTSRVKYKQSSENILKNKLKKVLTELMVAVKSDNLEKSRKLIFANSQHILDGKLELDAPYTYGFKINTGEQIKKHTMYHIAAYYGNVELLEILLYYEEYYMDKGDERYGYTPLHLACLNGQKETAAMLLTYGANAAKECYPKFCIEGDEEISMDTTILGTMSPNPKSMEVVQLIYSQFQ